MWNLSSGKLQTGRNLPAQIWKNLPSSIIRDSLGMEISFKMFLNSMYLESKSWKPEATQCSLPWTVKCRTWGYAYTPEHKLQLDKFQVQILQADAIMSVSWGGKLSHCTQTDLVNNNFCAYLEPFFIFHFYWNKQTSISKYSQLHS